MTFSALDSQLLGPLFATEAMRALFTDEAVLAAMVRAEAALARAQASCGLAPSPLADAIDAAGKNLDAGSIGRATQNAGVPTIPFVKDMQARLPKDVASSFHKGATTQDIFDTALILRLGPALDLIADDLNGIIVGLMKLAESERNSPCVGRTYGQHAAPITFGFKAAMWLTGVAETTEALPALRKHLLVVSLGGPVGTLAGLGAHGPDVLEKFAADLGLGTSPLAWHSLRGRVAEAGAWLARLIGSLAKLATDVENLASTDVGEVAEPHVPGRGGSSAMPHKRNPVCSTVILAAHAAAPHLAAMLASGMAASHERPAGLWHAEWHALPQLFGLASGALREARALAEELVPNPGRMRRNIHTTQGLLFADAAAAALAPALGRNAAHTAVEHAADEVRRTGTPLQTILARDFPQHPEIAAAFDLTPSIQAAQPWIDRALAFAVAVQAVSHDARSPQRI